MTDIVMPRLSDTMEEGTVLHWLKHDGDRVSRGEELVEIETDKASMTYESDSEGILETVAGEGDTLAVGELIARIGEPQGDVTATLEVNEGQARPAEEQQPAEEAHPAEETHPAEKSPAEESQPARDETHERIKASPVARRVAHETGVDLRTLEGSGPGGRIVKADVEASQAHDSPGQALPEQRVPREQASHEQPITPAAAKGDARTVELSRTQRTIARRMAESKATIPDFTLQVDVDMQRCVDLRAELKRLAGSSQRPTEPSQTRVPTYNDMIVKACALALREHPRANGSYRDGRFELHSRVNVGVAVALCADDPTAGALVVPTVPDADVKSLGEIARETHALAEKVRAATITPPELSGGTFTVSNLGMYGIARFSAIVNPPQAAILAVGAVEQRAVARDGTLVASHQMTVTLSCDHRILYGADAALFLARVRELLEEPAALTL